MTNFFNPTQQSGGQTQQTAAQPGGAVNPFAGVSGSQSSEDGVKFQEGTYLVRIGELISKRSQRLSCPLFIIETTVVERLSNEGNAPGTQPSQVVTFNGTHAAGNAKNFFLAAFKAFAEKSGAPPEAIEAITDEYMTANQAQCDAEMAKAVTPAQPFAGLVLQVTAIEKESQSTGRTYIRHQWEYVPGKNKPAAG